MSSRFRTLLTLGRVSNLPTVWSNCLAAWVLAGGGGEWRLGLLLASGSCLYIGGMFLNDACDVEFDRQHRQERPIPGGLISRGAVWRWAAGLLLAGVLLVIPFGGRALACALALLAAIVAYDFWHKRQPFAIGLVALCRFLLYLLASFAAAGTVSLRPLAAALGMATYVLGISLLARHESGVCRPPKWPLALLLIPALPAWLHASNSAHRGNRVCLRSFRRVAWNFTFSPVGSGPANRAGGGPSIGWDGAGGLVAGFGRGAFLDRSSPVCHSLRDGGWAARALPGNVTRRRNKSRVLDVVLASSNRALH